MKKTLFLMFAACQTLAMTAQTPDYKIKIALNDGSVLTARIDEVDSLTFSKLGKVEAVLSERYKTSTSLGVNIDIDANASRVQAVCVPASQSIGNVKEYVENNATVDSKTSYKKSFDMLEPETDYIVYALAYDQNGFASEVTSLALTTGKKSDDPFSVVGKNIATTSLDYVVTPKDASIKYVTQCTSLEMYKKWCDDGENAGDVLQHFVAYWTAMGFMYGESWQQQIKYDARTGTYDTEADYNSSTHLMWDATQVIMTFGISTTTGELLTPIQIDTLKTLAPQKSDNKITLTLKTNEWRNVVVTADVTNTDKYLVNVQPASLVDPHLEQGDLLTWLLYEGNTDLSYYAKSGSQDWEFTPYKGGQKYYAIGVGLDGGAPSTEPVLIEFELPEGSF